MDDKYVESSDTKKILYIDGKNLYGHSMCQPLPFDEIKFDKNVTLEDILNTKDDSDIGYFIGVDLSYPDNTKREQKTFQMLVKLKKLILIFLVILWKKLNFISILKLKNWSVIGLIRKIIWFIIECWNFMLRNGMIVDEVHGIISVKQSKWLEEYINFNTQKRNQAVNDFEKDFNRLLNNAFYGKTLENVRNRLKIEFIKKADTDKIIKEQSKLTLSGIHKKYENCDSYTFKQNEVTMDKPIYLGFSVLELSKLLMYETYYDLLQPYFGQEEIHLHNMDTDSFVLSINTKGIIKDLKNLEDIFETSNLDKNHELYSIKNKKVIGKFKIETPKSNWIDEFIALRSKMYVFKCGGNSRNNLKGISKSQSKNIKFEECYSCLFGGKYQQECDNDLIRSINHEKYLQRVKKFTLSQFDGKRCYINETESKPWNKYTWMVVKVNEKFEKTRHGKIRDKSKKYNLREERNTRNHDRVLSNKRKSYKFSWKNDFTFICSSWNIWSS